jgi:very-short-patch-repair endonuclease
VLETRVDRLLRRAGLRPVRQLDVVCGSRTYRLDFAWPHALVAVEADGFGAHGGRRAFDRDRRRLADLAAAGWRVLPVTWAQVERDPGTFVATVRATVRRAA